MEEVFALFPIKIHYVDECLAEITQELLVLRVVVEQLSEVAQDHQGAMQDALLERRVLHEFRVAKDVRDERQGIADLQSC